MPPIRLRPTQEVIEKDIRENNNGWKYYDIKRPNGTHFYIPNNSLYIVAEMLCGILTLLFVIYNIYKIITYKSVIIDPIAYEKKQYLWTYMTVFLVLGLIIAIVKIPLKKWSKYLKALACCALVSMIALIVMFSIRLKMDGTYNKNYFKTAYQNLCERNLIEKKSTSLNLNDLDEVGCIYEFLSAYDNFKTKTNIMFAMHLFINMLLIGKIIKENQRINGLKNVHRADDILFDEEKNVRF